MTKFLIVDIETSAKPANELNIPEFEPSKVLKDPEKIMADVEKKKKEWLDEAALHAERANVLVIGYLNDEGETMFIEGEEPVILKQFWNLYAQTSCNIIGHFIKGFDLPFLIRRSWLTGVRPPSSIIRGRYFCDRIVDTMELWACGEYRKTIGLNDLCRAFGINGKNGHGKKFGEIYRAGGKDKEMALEYLANDLLITKQCAEKMGAI